MLTAIARKFLSKRIRELENYSMNYEKIQREQLNSLLADAGKTEFGLTYKFNEIKSPELFSERVPLIEYDDIAPHIERMLKGDENVLWQGKIKHFAQSSGTTSAKSKYLPISKQSLKSMHYRGVYDAMALYFHLNPTSKFLTGKSLVVGAGKTTINDKGAHIGLLSGMLTEFGNPILGLFREPSYETCMIPDFSEKIEVMLPRIVNKNMVSVSGIPSWYQILFYRLLDYTKKDNILEIWPNLEVFFHGGVSFEPYREFFKEIIPSDSMNYLEIYNASEGFFGLQNDFSDPSLLLMLDYGIYYEFIPLEDIDNDQPKTIPIWGVEKGKPYALVVSNNSGLWRYKIGDVVQFTSTNPYKIQIIGRTKHYLNLCGEELMVGNADVAISIACEKTNSKVVHYTATAIFATAKKNAHHKWVIEFDVTPKSLDEFTRIFDSALCSANSDYESKRTNNIALDIPEIIVARKNLFTDWMNSKGITSAQQKIPRLQQNNDFINELIALNYT
jgi:hypothetical protein